MVAKDWKPAEMAEGVDPRLDNRQGAERPPLEQDPAVPQQVDGPDVLHQAEHAEAVAKLAEEEVGETKGMFSPGDHSLGEPDERGGNDAGQGDSVKETDQGRAASAPTDAQKGDVKRGAGGGK